MAEDDGLKELMSTLLRAGAVRRSDDSALLMCPEDDVHLGDEGLSKTMVACGAYNITRRVRNTAGSNGLTIRMPWGEDEPPRSGETWETAIIMSCEDEPAVAGNVRFRVLNGAIEMGDVSITDSGALRSRPVRSHNVKRR